MIIQALNDTSFFILLTINIRLLTGHRIEVHNKGDKINLHFCQKIKNEQKYIDFQQMMKSSYNLESLDFAELFHIVFFQRTSLTEDLGSVLGSSLRNVYLLLTIFFSSYIFYLFKLNLTLMSSYSQILKMYQLNFMKIQI